MIRNKRWPVFSMTFITISLSELTQITGDVTADPTLPRTNEHPCPKCDHREAVFFQSHSTKAEVSKRKCSQLNECLSMATKIKIVLWLG